MKNTEHNEKELLIQERLERDLIYIKESLLNELPQKPIAIYLCGGYGRNEGAWFFDNDNEPHPYNDYDLTVVTDHPLEYRKLQSLRKKIADALDIAWIDVDFYSSKDIKKMDSTIKHADFVYASRLLYGHDVRGQKIDASKIGIPDVILLYQTRMWTFLGSWEGDFHDLNVEEARFFNNQMAKAVLAACDMYLIDLKAYTPSYTDRVQKLCKKMEQNTTLCKYSRWALNEKLHPSTVAISRSEMMKRYFQVKLLFVEAFEKAMGKKAKFFLMPEKTKSYYLFQTLYCLRVIYNHILRCSNKVEKSTDIFIAQNYVFHANNGTEMKNEYLTEAAKLLKKWGYLSEEKTDWNELRTLTAAARNNI